MLEQISPLQPVLCFAGGAAIRFAPRIHTLRPPDKPRPGDPEAVACYRFGPVAEELDRKQDLLEAELHRYFAETCPALVSRWEAALRGLAPPLLRELSLRLRELDEVTQATNRQLSIAVRPVTEGGSTEQLLGQAMASLEHLNEIARDMMRWLDELLDA